MVAIAPGMFLAHSVVPSSGSTAMSTCGPCPCADLLADEQHRRFVALALADHHGAGDGQVVHLAPHGVDRRLVGRLLVAAPAQLRRRDRGALGHPRDLERQDAVEQECCDLLGLDDIGDNSLIRRIDINSSRCG